VSAEPLRVSVPIACPPEAAFRVFTESTGAWWPPGHTATGEPGSRIAIEAFVGGRFFERTAAGDEIEWGRILAWEPPRRLAYTWHLRADRADATEVWITFVPHGDGCRLEIEQRGWERLARGPERRERNRRGWDGLHFVAACGAAPDARSGASSRPG
jgi:uncharacterized protein YndB with AHSA1/START domain